MSAMCRMTYPVTRLTCANDRMISNRGPRRVLSTPPGHGRPSWEIDVNQTTPACAKPTAKYPLGRTGTIAGYGAHMHIRETVCDACADARRRLRSEERVRAHACFSKNCRGTLDGYRAHLEAGQRPCQECRGAFVLEPGAACAMPTIEFPQGRTGTAAGYQAHFVHGEPACGPCATAQGAKGLKRLHGLDEEQRVVQRAENAAAAKRWREGNPTEARDAKHRVIGRSRMAVRAAKNRPCADCGVRYPYYVMEFDHLDSSVKHFNISAGVTAASYDRLMAEIEKCDVVCANCHAERTHQRRRAKEVS